MWNVCHPAGCLFSCTCLSQTTLHRDECSIWWVVTISLSYRGTLFVCTHWLCSSINIHTNRVWQCSVCQDSGSMYIKALRSFICKMYMAWLYRRLHYALHGFWHKGDIFASGLQDKGHSHSERGLGQCLYTAIMVACARVDCLHCSTDRGCTNLRNLSCTVYLVYVSSMDRWWACDWLWCPSAWVVWWRWCWLPRDNSGFEGYWISWLCK